MRDLLRQVSRSFYLTLRVLPHSINAQLSLTYLLARAADTVADTHLVEAPRRRDSLLQIRKCIQDACAGRKPSLPDFGNMSETQEAIAGDETSAERALLEKLETILDKLRGFSADDRLRICSVLETITRGQEIDLVRFGAATASRIAAFQTDEELDEYTYLVAGCVGEFWTHMCRAHVFPKAALDDELLLANGISFGKGLQLVNILRDLPKDLRQGRCYIPENQLSKHSLSPEDLLNASKMDRFRPLYDSYLMKAESYLATGWRYTTMLPFRYARIRLACAWPILIGMRTVEMLRRDNILDEGLHRQIHQSDIRMLILRSVVFYPSPNAWNSLFDSVSLEKSGKSRKKSMMPRVH